MKIFIPMSDRIVDEKGELSADLVPFNPDFLSCEGIPARSRPSNWINDSDYASACRRLFGQQPQEMSLA